jgi:hypothetical protein
MELWSFQALQSVNLLFFSNFCRASGDPLARLHILALNPTFSIDPDSEMLHPECPSMGMVLECGLNSGNCFATDIFPLRFNLDTEYCDDPFFVFPEFKWVFLKRYLPNFLKFGGEALLIFGNSAFDTFASVRRLEEEDLGAENAHLEVYTERVIIWFTSDPWLMVFGRIWKIVVESVVSSLKHHTPRHFLRTGSLKRILNSRLISRGRWMILSTLLRISLEYISSSLITGRLGFSKYMNQ